MQDVKVTIKGLTPLIMHSSAGMIEFDSDIEREKKNIVSKRGSNRTASDDARLREIECAKAIWLDSQGEPTIPPGAIRSCIEQGARKRKQGGDVREGMVVLDTSLEFDRAHYGDDMKAWQKSMQFVATVVVGQSRVVRTRAMLDAWSCTFTMEIDEELVDKAKLEEWLDIAGRRVGLGDWRPAKSGVHGRFKVVSLEVE